MFIGFVSVGSMVGIEKADELSVDARYLDVVWRCLTLCHNARGDVLQCLGFYFDRGKQIL